MRPEIGDFAFQPDVGVFALQSGTYRSNEVAHGPDAPFRRTEVEGKLVQRSHWKEVYSRCQTRYLRRTGGLPSWVERRVHAFRCGHLMLVISASAGEESAVLREY